MSLSPGARLGPYEIVAPLGEGGMGEVWKARDTRLNRTVALKVSKAEFSERFEREARAVAALNHPKICTLHDVGPNYLVMELVEGVPLHGPVPVPKAVEYAAQILDALDAAHKKGITHRDLKPANVLVTKQGIKLLDFGLAKQVAPLGGGDSRPAAALTSEGQILGTLQYMAPEQLQGKDADARSDIFAFGCVLYEMLSGRRAFEGASPASVIAAILERQPAPLSTTPPLDRIIRTCLAKDPDERFQNALDLKRALQWSATSTEESRPAPAPSRPWLWAAAAVLVIGVVLGGLGVARFRQPPVDVYPYRLQLDSPDGTRFIFGNNTGGLALSPDGRTAAYVASGNARSGLWVQPLDGAVARLIAGTDGASYPFWSPDNKSIAFFLGHKLLRVNLAGGAPSTICERATSPRGGAWSADGRILYGSVAGGLFEVPASGGTAVPITTLDSSRSEGYHRWPQMLPGGRFLFSVQSGKPENCGIYAASFAKPGERVPLLTTEINALYAPGGEGRNYLLWLRGGALVAQEFDADTLKMRGEPQQVADPVAWRGVLGQMNVAVSASGLLLYSASGTASGQFSLFDRKGTKLRQVGEPGEYGSFSVSPDQRRVVAALDRAGSTKLWLLEMERGIAGPFISDPGFSLYPTWSPDGRTVVFSSGTPRNLFRKESNGTGKMQSVIRSPNSQFATDWSRDGSLILYQEVNLDNQLDLWVLHVTADGKPVPNSRPEPYLQTPANERWGRFSPETPPRWVAYQSDETRQREVYIRAYPDSRGVTQVSKGGGQYPQWGEGGRELFYISLDNKLMVVDLKIGTDAVEPSPPRELFPLPGMDAGTRPYEASPDGQRFLVLGTPGQTTLPLTAIVNWPALLKKAAPGR